MANLPWVNGILRKEQPKRRRRYHRIGRTTQRSSQMGTLILKVYSIISAERKKNFTFHISNFKLYSPSINARMFTFDAKKVRFLTGLTGLS